MISPQHRQRWLSILFALVAVVLCWLATKRPTRTGLGADASAALIWTAAGVAGLVAVLFLLTSYSRGITFAWLRLDWFLPVLRRRSAPSRGAFMAVLRRIIPTKLQSDHQKKKRGWIRKSLRRLGISWLASPVRRLSQGICLLAFLGLFFYVCWPYDTRPAAPGRYSQGWVLEDVRQSTAEYVLRQTRPEETQPIWQLQANHRVYVVIRSDTFDESVSDDASLGSFRVSNVTEDSIALTADTPSAEVFDAFLTPSNVFELHELDPLAWPSHYADNLHGKEVIAAEIFLVIDPLVSLSTAIASRSWVWSLTCAACILLVCLVIPRGFCGYLCPLGTTIDLFDWAIAGRTKRFQVSGDGWWVHIKYYLLAGTLIAALAGVLLSGFVSAIPVITRAMLFLVDPIVSGTMRGWHLVPPIHVGHVVSMFLFLGVLSLGFLRPRFWCKYVCPSGAVFSLGNLFRVTERQVESSCIHCNKCVEICPFDAIKPDFTTRTTDCTLCQSCGGVCPTHAIKFVERWNVVELKVADDPPTHETPLGRRGFLSLASGGAAASVGGLGLASMTKHWGARLDDPDTEPLVRPPGSVPEREFLEMCIRCGECFKACPNNVLQPVGFEQGLEGLWTPMVKADWAGCESSCNACGQVCPTGAIRALPMAEKRVARMGLAVVNESTCLPFAGREACDLCVQECNAAGYFAIEYTQTGVELDTNGQPIEGTGFLAPVVLQESCVGCGLCQTRCNVINRKEKGLLNESAIIVQAGPGKEDRMMSGSYRERRAKQTEQARIPSDPPSSSSPFDSEEAISPSLDQFLEADPFGVEDGKQSRAVEDGPEPTLPSNLDTDPADSADPFGLLP